MSFEEFSNDYKKQKLKDIAEIMKDEYINNKDLTSFSSLNGESFL